MKTKMRLRTIVKTTALILVLIAASITTASAITCTCGDVCVNTTGWWRAGDEFNPSGTPIQSAIDNAAEGYIICVMDGTYIENVNIDKPLTIQSEHNLGAIVQAASTDDHVFEVTADYVNISGFSVRGATSSGAVGIRLSGADYCDISENYAHGNCHGIYLYYSGNNMLRDNTVSNNDGGGEAYNGRGIYLYESSSNTLTGNIASDNGLGIYLEFSGSNTLTGNIASNNNVCGIGLSYLSHNTLTSNIANSNNVVGFSIHNANSNTFTSNTASENRHGFFTWYSENNVFTSNIANANSYCGIAVDDSSNHNIFTSNTANFNSVGILLADLSSYNILTSNTASYNIHPGIALSHSVKYNTLTSNTASYNQVGIYLYNSSNDNTLTGNTANSNDYGILLRHSSNDNIITGNTANLNNINGIRLHYSSNNNLIYNNYFDNTNNAYDDGTNSWHIAKEEGANIIGGSYLGGNYWSDYAGWDCDCDRDGLGDMDVPYNSDGNIQNGGDSLPLAVSDTIPPIITVFTPTPYGLYSVSVTLDFSASDDQCGVNTLEGHLTNTDGVSQIVNSGDTVTEPGVYTLTLTAVDYACNPSESEVFFVVYDPEGGFATGGGWFYPDEESTLSGGRANFGFVAKYKKGSSTGNLKFQYKDADINLKSTSIDWLVISGVSAQFQGTCTINGNGLYTFRVRAKDNGEPGVGVDHFDVMIWDGTDTEGDPIHKAKNVLAGGNIVVHKK